MPRFHFALADVTQLHADIGWFIGATAVALAIGLWHSAAPKFTVRASQLLLAGLGVQGVLGYVQYFTHLPAGLVWVHVAMAVTLWVLAVRLYLSTRTRDSLPEASATQPTSATEATAAALGPVREQR